MEQDTSNLFVQHAQDVTLVTFNDEEILEETCIQGLDKALMAIVEDARRPTCSWIFPTFGLCRRPSWDFWSRSKNALVRRTDP